MAMHVDTTQAAARGDAAHGYDAPDLRIFVIALFFIFGGITSLNDIIIPKLKELFTLDHATSMLVQSAFFLAYALFSLPAAAIVRFDGLSLHRATEASEPGWRLWIRCVETDREVRLDRAIIECYGTVFRLPA